MVITPNALLHMIMIWSYPLIKETKRGALRGDMIFNNTETFNGEVLFTGVYKHTKCGIFKDVYTLVDLKITVNSEVMLHFKNMENYISDEQLNSEEYLPILNGVVTDKNVQLSEIFNKFKRIV